MNSDFKNKLEEYYTVIESTSGSHTLSKNQYFLLGVAFNKFVDSASTVSLPQIINLLITISNNELSQGQQNILEYSIYEGEFDMVPLMINEFLNSNKGNKVLNSSSEEQKIIIEDSLLEEIIPDIKNDSPPSSRESDSRAIIEDCDPEFGRVVNEINEFSNFGGYVQTEKASLNSFSLLPSSSVHQDITQISNLQYLRSKSDKLDHPIINRGGTIPLMEEEKKCSKCSAPYFLRIEEERNGSGSKHQIENPFENNLSSVQLIPVSNNSKDEYNSDENPEIPLERCSLVPTPILQNLPQTPPMRSKSSSDILGEEIIIPKICNYCKQIILEYPNIPAEPPTHMKLVLLSNCGHAFHGICIHKHIKEYVENRNKTTDGIICPHPACNRNIDSQEVALYLETADYELYIASLADYSNLDFISHCPNIRCQYQFVYKEAPGTNYFKCPMCKRKYCLNCRCRYHKNINCEEFQISQIGKKVVTSTNNIPTNIARSISEMFGMNKKEEEKKSVLESRNNDQGFAIGMKIKECPKCKKWIQKTKDESMIECKCGKSFCFYCGRDFYSCKCHSPIPLTKKSNSEFFTKGEFRDPFSVINEQIQKLKKTLPSPGSIISHEKSKSSFNFSFFKSNNN